MRKEIEGDGYVISIFGGDTEEWQEAKLNLEEKKEELSNRIELRLGFGELGGIMNNSEEDKIRDSGKESIMRESVGKQLPAIQEERENDFGAAISGCL